MEEEAQCPPQPRAAGEQALSSTLESPPWGVVPRPRNLTTRSEDPRHRPGRGFR